MYLLWPNAKNIPFPMQDVLVVTLYQIQNYLYVTIFPLFHIPPRFEGLLVGNFTHLQSPALAG